MRIQRKLEEIGYLAHQVLQELWWLIEDRKGEILFALAVAAAIAAMAHGVSH